jgi:hypothetical protein
MPCQLSMPGRFCCPHSCRSSNASQNNTGDPVSQSPRAD